jgi:hypothetical protein
MCLQGLALLHVVNVIAYRHTRKTELVRLSPVILKPAFGEKKEKSSLELSTNQVSGVSKWRYSTMERKGQHETNAACFRQQWILKTFFAITTTLFTNLQVPHLL